MTFNQLRYVVEAAKIGSISKAARLLFLTQSNLSSTILSLEKELGIKLFLRTQDGIQLTDQGEMFMVHARSILNSYDELMQLNAPKEKERFHIGVISSSSFCTNAFAKLCSRYYDRKNLHMTMQNCDLDHSVDLLRTDQMDLEVMMANFSVKYHLHELRDQKKIQLDVLGTLPVNILLRRGHPLLAHCDPDDPGKDFDFQALTNYPCVDYVKNQLGTNLLTAVMQETRTFLPNSAINMILVTDRDQKDGILLSTNAFALGVSRAPSQRNQDAVIIPLPGCAIELCLCTSPLYPASRFIPEFRSLLIDELMLSPEFQPAC